ncbi:protein DCL homolog, chloroplastic-like [Apium graveolens]|uniref:protein DCL homolog, chloroplastic-like n=1 Tax=Apium graveolens TaxID=4045 RepID=UPI003D78D67C
MAYCCVSLQRLHLDKKPIFTNLSSYSSASITLSLPCNSPRFNALKATTSNEDSYGSDLLRKPAGRDFDDDDEEEEESKQEEEIVDWEDKILEDTVPLVGFVRMVLHSGKYESGDQLSPEHEKTILERLLAYHPECEKKIGSGVDYITIGYHPDFERSRCLFIVRKDGELVDFSYWKCLEGLIRKKYPLYADSFIPRHFRRGRRID